MSSAGSCDTPPAPAASGTCSVRKARRKMRQQSRSGTQAHRACTVVGVGVHLVGRWPVEAAVAEHVDPLGRVLVHLGVVRCGEAHVAEVEYLHERLAESGEIDLELQVCAVLAHLQLRNCVLHAERTGGAYIGEKQGRGPRSTFPSVMVHTADSHSDNSVSLLVMHAISCVSQPNSSWRSTRSE